MQSLGRGNAFALHKAVVASPSYFKSLKVRDNVDIGGELNVNGTKQTAMLTSVYLNPNVTANVEFVKQGNIVFATFLQQVNGVHTNNFFVSFGTIPNDFLPENNLNLSPISVTWASSVSFYLAKLSIINGFFDIQSDPTIVPTGLNFIIPQYTSFSYLV